MLKTITRKGFSPSEVAEMLGVSMATIYREMERGNLESVKIGTRRVITQWDLEAYIGKERTKTLLMEYSDDVTKENISDKRDRIDIIKKARGRFAHLSGSTDDFIQEKQKDIEIENRRWEKK